MKTEINEDKKQVTLVLSYEELFQLAFYTEQIYQAAFLGRVPFIPQTVKDREELQAIRDEMAKTDAIVEGNKRFEWEQTR
jgi:hypothetical protein